MCNCPQMNASRDFIFMMKVVSHTSEQAGINNFLAEMPEDLSHIKVASCTLDRWVISTSLTLYELTGAKNNQFICQDETGTVTVSPEGCEYIADCMKSQQSGIETGLKGYPRAVGEFRVHGQSSGPADKLGH